MERAYKIGTKDFLSEFYEEDHYNKLVKILNKMSKWEDRFNYLVNYSIKEDYLHCINSYLMVNLPIDIDNLLPDIENLKLLND